MQSTSPAFPTSTLPAAAVPPAAAKVGHAAIPIGELLVRQGQLAPLQVRHILDVQQVTGRPFGELAERMFGVRPAAVADAWVEQYVARHGLHDVSEQPCDRACVALVETRQAWQFRLVPMRLDRVGDVEHLLIAADRRGLVRAMNFATRSLPATPSVVVAEPQSLRKLLTTHYPAGAHWAEAAFK